MLSIRQAAGSDDEVISAVLCASICHLCAADHNGDPDLIARPFGVTKVTPLDRFRKTVGFHQVSRTGDV